MKKNLNKIFELLRSKASVKQDVFFHGKEVFGELKKNAGELINEIAKVYNSEDPRVKVHYEDVSAQEFRLTLGGDILLFHMHTNVFQYDKSDYFWKHSYFKEDITRSYGIVIMVYNFLTDSIKLERENDLGYLIGRIFINKENHFSLESKLRLKTRFPYLNKQVFDKESQEKILSSLLSHSMEFELNLPPFGQVQTVTVAQAQDFKNRIKTKTAKKLGFQFGDENASEIE